MNELSSSQFPNGLRHADVMPVFKKDDKSDKSNYRPINIFSNLVKYTNELCRARFTLT